VISGQPESRKKSDP